MSEPEIGDAWFAIVADETIGPFSFARLRGAAREGRLGPADPVRRDLDAAWRRADEVAGLFDPAARVDAGDAPASGKPGSYVLRHWRGELSLASSYWINNLGVTIAFGAIVALAGYAASGARSMLAPLALVTGVWSMAIVVAAWQTVGTWRSANRARRRTGRRLWPGITQALLVASVAYAGWSLATAAWPQLVDAYRAAAGDPAQGERGVRILRAGSEIEISGFLGRGSVESFKLALDAAPTARLLHLNSPGGRLGVALDIADLVRARGMDTLVEVQCASACTLVQLAGIKRWVRPGAVIGFHAATFGGMDSLFDGPLRDAYAAAGLPAEFIHRALATPSTELWTPNQHELSLASVITDTAGEDQFARAGFGPHPTAEAGFAELEKNPLYRALQQLDPDGYGLIREGWSRLVLDGLAVSDLSDVVWDRVVAAAPRALAIAPPIKIRQIAAVRLEELDATFAVDPVACWKYAHAEIRDAPRFLNPTMAGRYRTLLKELMFGAAIYPAPPTDPASAERLLALALARLAAQGHPPDAITAALSRDGDRPAFCPALKLLIQTALAMEKEDGAALLRHLLGDNYFLAR